MTKQEKPNLTNGTDYLKQGRQKFIHNNSVIYEWEQTLEDIILYIKPPKNIKAKHLDIKITSTSLSIGLKGNPPFLNEKFLGKIKSDDSLWTLDDGEIEINLSKNEIGKVWECVFPRHSTQKLDNIQLQNAKKQLLIERFSRENPHMDFSNAKFDGYAPDPDKFLDGIDTNKLNN